MLQELKQICRPVVWGLVLAIFVGSASTISSISLMGLSAWLISSAALQTPLYMLSLAIVGVRFCGISRAVLRYLERYVAHNVGFSLFTKFRVIVLAKVIAALPFKRQTANGDAFEIIVNAVDSLRDSCLRFFLPPIITSISAICIAIWVGFYDSMIMAIVLLSWICLAVVLPYIIWLEYRKLPAFKFALAKDILEFYDGNKELIVFNYVQTRLKEVRCSIDEYQSYRTVLFKIKLKANLYGEFLLGLFFVCSLGLLVEIVNKGQLNAVIAITILLVFQAVLESLAMLPALVEHFDEAYKRWQDLVPFMTDKSGCELQVEAIKSRDKTHELFIDNLAYGYEKILLSNLNIRLAKGEKTLIIGPSGCGKSTLFYVLTALLKQKQGDIFLQGINYANLSIEDIRAKYAVSFQEHHIFNLSIRDNFKMIYEDISDAEILKALEQVYMLEFVNKVGLDYILQSDGNNLSGGQKHRIQIAICLAKQKDIILLDEPTSGLDIKTANNLCREIMQSYKDTTMLVTSHDISLINYFDNIIICDDEKIIEQGKIKMLLADRNSYLAKLTAFKNLI